MGFVLNDASKGMIIKDIELEKIRKNPLNDNPIIDIESLVKDIQSSGLLVPLSVYKNDDGTFTLISGERRFTAVSKIFDNEETYLFNDREYEDAIPCYVLTKSDNALIEYEQINRANDTREMSDEEMIEFTRLVLKRYEYFKANGLRPKGEKREWVGRMIHKKGRTASNWIAKAENLNEPIPSEKKDNQSQKKSYDVMLPKVIKQLEKLLELAENESNSEASQQITHVLTLIKNIENGGK